MIKTHLRAAFLAPLQSRARRAMFAGQFIGSLGVYFLQIFIAIDMLRFGIDGMLTYFVIRFGVAGFVLFPLFTWAYRAWPRRRFLAVVNGSQLLALAPVFWPQILTQPYLIGLCVAFASTGYWHCYHLVMTAHTSEKGRGYELSLAQVVQTCGGIAGYLAAGAAATAHADLSLALYGFAAQIFATFMFCRSIPAARFAAAQTESGQISLTSLRDEIFGNPWRSILTLLDAGYSVLSDILMPAWLKLIGITAFGVGIVSSIYATIQVLATPLTGKFYADDKKTELRLGSAISCLSWLPWCFGPQAALLVFSIPLWACGNLLYRTGLQGRWYHNRSATAILAREMLLTAMRLVIAWIFIPIMFLHPVGVAWLAAGCAALMLAASFRQR